MFIYLRKATTLITINPFFQIDYSPSFIIACKFSVYLLYRFRECNLDCLVLVVNDFQMVERSELVMQSGVSSPHLCGSSKRTFTSAVYLVIFIVSIVPVTIKPVKMDLQRFPIMLSFTSVVFISFNVFGRIAPL